MSLKVLLEKAKTPVDITPLNPNSNDWHKRWVSVDDLKQWLEKLNERALEIDKPSNEYFEVCSQTRQYRTLLKDVLGLPLEGSK